MITIKNAIVSIILLFFISPPNVCQATNKETKNFGDRSGSIRPIQEQAGGSSGSIRPIQEQAGGSSGSIRPIQEQAGGSSSSIRPIQVQSDGSSVSIRPIQEQSGSFQVQSDGSSVSIRPIQEQSGGFQVQSDSSSVSIRPIQVQSDGSSGSIRAIQEQAGGSSGSIRPIQAQSDGLSGSIRPIQVQSDGSSGSIRAILGQEQAGGSIRPPVETDNAGIGFIRSSSSEGTIGGSIRHGTPIAQTTIGGSIREIFSETSGSSIRPVVSQESARRGSIREISVGPESVTTQIQEQSEGSRQQVAAGQSLTSRLSASVKRLCPECAKRSKERFKEELSKPAENKKRTTNLSRTLSIGARWCSSCSKPHKNVISEMASQHTGFTATDMHSRQSLTASLGSLPVQQSVNTESKQSDTPAFNKTTKGSGSIRTENSEFHSAIASHQGHQAVNLPSMIVASRSSHEEKQSQQQKIEKIYWAVARGNIKGVFDTWEECMLSINGYPDALMRTFESIDAAQQFVKDPDSHQLTLANSSLIGQKEYFHNGVRAVYTDGSTHDGITSIGVFWGDGDPKNCGEIIPNAKPQGGELYAIIRALEIAKQHNYPGLAIMTDYESVIDVMEEHFQKWEQNEEFRNVQGRRSKHLDLYKRINELRQEFLDKQFPLYFVKVPAHSNDYGNNQADRLASKARNVVTYYSIPFHGVYTSHSHAMSTGVIKKQKKFKLRLQPAIDDYMRRSAFVEKPESDD